jgi:hypothetical protein
VSDSKSTEETLRDKFIKLDVDGHRCDPEGFGCEVEQFKTESPGAIGTYYRCKLQREYYDSVIRLFDQELVAEQTKAATHFADGYEAGMKELAKRVEEARMEEAKDIRKNIEDLGTPVYFALQRIDEHIATLNNQTKEENED